MHDQHADQNLVPVRTVPQRSHWVNTLVGILDQAFHLTDEEQVFVVQVISRLLESLNIPDRSDSQTLPAPVALEISGGFYTRQLDGPRTSGIVRPVRHITEQDAVVSLEAWRETLLAMLLTAHPDLTPNERLVTAKVLADLLHAIGVPTRAAAFFPDDVIRMALQIDNNYSL